MVALLEPLEAPVHPIEALRRVAGERAVRLIRREPDESIIRIVQTWAAALDATRALRLGFAGGLA